VATLRRWGGRLGILAGLAALGLPALAVLQAIGPDLFPTVATLAVLGLALATVMAFLGLFGKMH
jgi:hypothetical protein